MKAVKRWRYYCDFCKKSGASAFHMKNHEGRCTLNPKRDCKCCESMCGNTATPMSEMLALLPDPVDFMYAVPASEFGYECLEIASEALRDATHVALPALRTLTEDCPVCILAALRQRGIPVPIVTDFNFTDELEHARKVMSDHREEQEYRPSMYGGY